MDLLMLGLIAAGLFGLALLGAALWSIAVVWRKAAARGLSVSLLEARALTKFYALEDEFLDYCVAFKKTDPKLSVKDIVRHHMADGNTATLLEQWKQLKTVQAPIAFKSLVLYHLAGKDVDELILNFNRVYELSIPDIEENKLLANYSCRFKIAGDSSGWIEPDLKDYEQMIREKITLALLTGDPSDFEALASFIKENYLDDNFWTKLCHGQVIEQQVHITRA